MKKLGPSMTGCELTSFQKRCGRHLSFSLTLACPLRCAHCMVTTIPPGRAADATLSLEATERFASEFSELVTAGVTQISFTGGEPLLARPQLDLLVVAAAAAGISVSVVTACHWAKTSAAANAAVANLPGVTHWHLSTDRFHLAHLPLAHVWNAARAALAYGCRVTIRAAVARPIGAEDEAFLDLLQAELPPGVSVALQPVALVGRARDLGLETSTRGTGAPPVPCLSTGPLIDHDGALHPCCSGLAEHPEISPFAQADAAREGLAAAVVAWREDPLMRLVRAIGFGFPALWAEEALGHSPVSPSPEHPCDFCLALWRAPGAREAVMRRVSAASAREKIKALDAALFGAG